jgi:hypothetical protein
VEASGDVAFPLRIANAGGDGSAQACCQRRVDLLEVGTGGAELIDRAHTETWLFSRLNDATQHRVYSVDRARAASNWCSLLTYGLLGPYSAGHDQTLSGFSDFFDPGSGLLPCVVHADTYYRGAVAFDLSQLDVIVSADLTFTVDSSISANGDVVGQNPPACNATTLGMATGNEHYFFDSPVSLPPCGRSLDVGVSDQVRQWLGTAPSRPNFGFIIAGPKIDFPDDLPDDNTAKVTWYGNFQLTVLYDPSQNPRAPQ